MGRGSKGRRASPPVAIAKPRPWGTIAAVVAVVALAGVVFGYAYSQIAAKEEREATLARFAPSDNNRDPSTRIPGVTKREYKGANHVTAQQRVAYDKVPPFGGPHDQVWAACDGVVYDEPIRSENVIHSLEHGAVWISYQPRKVDNAALESLRSRVEGENYLLLSPVPTQKAPISLQSWGHQLTVSSAQDKRIDQFITALKANRFTHPEVGASCSAMPGRFDPDNPPPFNPNPPGPNAMPMTRQGGNG